MAWQPYGQHVSVCGAVCAQGLPVGKIRGLGGKLGAALEELCGCSTADQVAALPLDLLARHFPDRAGWIAQVCRAGWIAQVCGGWG